MVAVSVLGVSSASATPGITNFWGSIGNFGQTEGGRFEGRPGGVATNDASGDVYVADTGNNRIQKFDEDGNFIRAWGFDVNSPVAAPGSASFEICVVKASCRTGDSTAIGGVNPGGQLSSPSGVAVNQANGHVYVSDVSFNRVQEFTSTGVFVRSFGQDVVNGGGTGFEVCSVAADCKAGVTTGATGGVLQSIGYPAVAPIGSPNEGNVLVPNAGKLRVEEFTAEGAFVRAFGWDVVSSGPGNDTTPPINQFEVCNGSAGDVCKEGVAGSGAGQFVSGTPGRVAEDTAGAIYTVEKTANFRVQKFMLPANILLPHGPFDSPELEGSGVASRPLEVAVDDQGFVYVAKSFLVGTGVPPVELPPGLISSGQSRNWQDRILKVDPTANSGSGGVIDTMIVNPGEAPGIEGDISTGVAPEDITGLAVLPAGAPIYFSTGEEGISRRRVYRVDETTGLTVSIVVSDVGAATAKLEGTITPPHTAAPVKTSYRFEYSKDGATWLKAPVTDVVIGNGSDGGESSTCSAEDEAATCHVIQELDGLDLEQTYQCRLVASTTYRAAVATSADPCEFTTEAHKPTAITGSAVWSGPPASNPSLSFTGRLNPQGARTAYFFQYVSQADFETSGYDNGRIAPRVAADAGHGVVTQDVVAVAAGLDPASAYRFRLVASNAAGVTFPEDPDDEGTVAPPQASDRFYELVSDGDSQGSSLPEQRLTVSDDGERAMFIAVAFGEQQGAPYITNPNIAERSASGWEVKPMAPDPDLGGSFEGNGDAAVTKRLWLGQFPSGANQWMVRNLEGSLTPLSSPLLALERTGQFATGFEGASSDFRTLVFSASNSTLLPGETLVEGQGHSNLYELSDAGGANPTVEIVNRDGGGSVVGGACGARLGSLASDGAGFTARTRAVSADGSVIHFSTRAGTPTSGSCGTTFPVRVFKRVDGASTVEVSDCAKTPPVTCPTSGDDYYWSASADGSRTYFSTARQLTDSDTDSGADLYLYDSSPPAGEPNLAQVSAGEIVAGDHPTIGAGANVLGVSDVSMDGSRVYFVATGRLTTGATHGANNLFVYERDAAHPDGRIGFVATLAPGAGDAFLWNRVKKFPEGKPAYALPRYVGEGAGRLDGDGHLLVFLSRAALLPAEDQDAVDDLYRYDDDSGQLSCLSCAGDGPVDVRLYGQQIAGAHADQIQQERIASEDGSEVVFTTREKLLGEDANSVQDVYLWDSGLLSVISGATGESGVLGAGKDGIGGAAISPDGGSIFFLTRATLLPQDTDNGGYDYYVTRVGGGFPQVEPPIDPCNPNPEACKSPQPEPPLSPFPGTGLPGIGNELPPKACPKGKVLKKSKCVKKQRKQKHGRGKHRRTGSNGRAGR